MKHAMDREKHDQQVELLKHQNKVSEDKLTYLKEMERKLKQMVIDWRKEEDKSKVIKQMNALLFKKNEQKAVNKMQKKIDSRFAEVGGEIKTGDKVKLKLNHQVGQVLELRGKKAVVKIGMLPIHVDLKDLVLVKSKQDETDKK